MQAPLDLNVETPYGTIERIASKTLLTGYGPLSAVQEGAGSFKPAALARYSRGQAIAVASIPAVNFCRAVHTQCRVLHRAPLVVFHGSIMTITYDTCKPLKTRARTLGSKLPLLKRGLRAARQFPASA